MNAPSGSSSTGFDDPSDAVYRLATTLLDPAAAPAAEVAALYHERWEVETAYDEVKTHILGPGAILRSKSIDAPSTVVRISPLSSIVIDPAA